MHNQNSHYVINVPLQTSVNMQALCTYPRCYQKMFDEVDVPRLLLTQHSALALCFSGCQQPTLLPGYVRSHDTHCFTWLLSLSAHKVTTPKYKDLFVTTQDL